VAQLKEQFPSIVVDIQNGNETSLCNVTDYPTDKANRDIVVIIVPLALAACLVVVGVLMCHYISKTRQKSYVPSWQLEANSQLYMNVEGQGQTPPVDDAWEINRSKIILEKELGKGTFGLVYSGIWHKDENTKPVNVAVKMLHKNASQQDRMSFLYEASVMKHFNSNQVVRLLGIVSRGNQALAVLELMTKGDLKSFLHSLRPEDEGPLTYKNFPLSENDVLQIAAQIATGMAYLTSLKFVHRDLAARNCMVTDNLTVKIGDFGLTRDVYESDYYRKIGQGPLPVRWMPPESLMDGKFDHASDVWSFGIVLWEVATLGIQPYPGMSNDQVCQFVMDGGVMKVGDLTHVPNLYVLLMKKCWLYKASNRPTFENIVEYLPDISAE
jgi:insulin-like growth factor 1 receptor